MWGGIAGCMPVLIGWAAVTGSLAWAPVVLFGVVFFWTPPHFWPLAMRYKDDYARGRRADAAGGGHRAPGRSGDRRLHLGHGAVLAGAVAGRAAPRCSTRSWPPSSARSACGRRTACSAGLNAGKTGVDLRPMRFFHWSNTYLALLFLAVAIDPLLA